MTSRLGPFAVVRTRFINTHIPERAAKLEPVVARMPDDPAAAPDPALPRPLRLLPSPEPITVIAEVPDGPPVRMVWRRVSYRFAKAAGPERIESEWWRSGQKLDFLLPGREVAAPPTSGEAPAPKLVPLVPEQVMRDYYVAEDEAGRRFWLFRQGVYGRELPPSWYLHGFFS
jgi:protein ImuB